MTRYRVPVHAKMAEAILRGLSRPVEGFEFIEKVQEGSDLAEDFLLGRAPEPCIFLVEDENAPPELEGKLVTPVMKITDGKVYVDYREVLD